MVWARRVSRSSPPAQGFAPAASPHTPGGCLQILASAGAAKNGPMRDFVWIRGGLIGVLLLYGWMEHAFPSLGAGLAHSILLKSGRRFDFSG